MTQHDFFTRMTTQGIEPALQHLQTQNPTEKKLVAAIVEKINRLSRG